MLVTGLQTGKVQAQEEDLIADGVYAGEIELSGMTVSQAEDVVQSYVTALGEKQITLMAVQGNEVTVPAADLQLKWANPEIIEEAVEAAKENAKRNRLENCEFLAGDVLKVLDDIEQKPDFIVLDPPRDGIHPKALEKIISYGVEKMVYISCKPTSLARDLEVLLARGYEAERICCVDMFPQTTGIENVCLLGKRKPDAKVKIGIDMDDYYRIRENAESK